LGWSLSKIRGRTARRVVTAIDVVNVVRGYRRVPVNGVESNQENAPFSARQPRWTDIAKLEPAIAEAVRRGVGVCRCVAISGRLFGAGVKLAAPVLFRHRGVGVFAFWNSEGF